jgi:hypothetical protein
LTAFFSYIVEGNENSSPLAECWRLFFWRIARMETIKQVMAALYVALGEAAGGPQAMRVANRVLRDAIADRAVDDPVAIELLESISHDEDDMPEIQILPPECRWWDEINSLAATAH